MSVRIVVSSRAGRLLPLAAVLLLIGAGPLAAQQASEPTAFQRILGKLGVLEIPPDEPIDYRERAPLVVPPSNVLVPPRNPEDISKYNPDWPIDHDNPSRRAAAVEEQRRVDDEFYSGRPLRPDELNRVPISKQEAARRDAAARQKGAMTAGEAHARGLDRLSPAELGFRGWFSKDSDQQVTFFTGEPQRRSLIEPPPGYRTPSPNAPYGIVTQRPEPTKAPTVFDRQTHPDDTAARR